MFGRFPCTRVCGHDSSLGAGRCSHVHERRPQVAVGRSPFGPAVGGSSAPGDPCHACLVLLSVRHACVDTNHGVCVKGVRHRCVME